MSNQRSENIQFYISEDDDCPYLPNLKEKKIFTHLAGKRSKDIMLALNDYGFRRSQNVLYRPICDNCSMCKPVRTITSLFKASKNQRRIINKNKDIVSTELSSTASREQYDLFKRYLDSRHFDGNMSDMSYEDYELMVEDSPVSSIIVEYRLQKNDGANGALIGVVLSDILGNGISMVYSFFDPDLQSRSLGKFMILDNIKRVNMLKLDYLYLGYWVLGSKKMEYKIEFEPLEIVQDQNGWENLIIT